MEKILKDIKENRELLVVPIIFLILIFGMKALWTYFGFPTQDDLIAYVQTFFLTYGLWVILVASILESVIFIGWYFPGSLVIFLGVSATAGNPILGIKTVITVCLGMLIGYSVNYILGRYGWYKLLMKFGFKDELEKIERRVKERGLIKGAFMFYVYPGTSSLLSTAFGVLKYNYLTFLSFTLISVIIWNTLWGVLVYFYGMPVFKILTNPFILVTLFSVYFYYIYNKEKDKLGLGKNI